MSLVLNLIAELSLYAWTSGSRRFGHPAAALLLLSLLDALMDYHSSDGSTEHSSGCQRFLVAQTMFIRS